MFGHKIIGSAENIINEIFDDTEDRLTELVGIRKDASDRMKDNEMAMKNKYDKNRKAGHSYHKIGDLVRIERSYNEKDSAGKPKKLLPKLQGPYGICKVLPNDRYLIEDTPLTRKNNKRYENVLALDKIHPWVSFQRDICSSQSDDDNDSE